MTPIPGLAGLALALAAVGAAAAAPSIEPRVIPNPASLERKPGEFGLTPATALIVPAGDAEAERVAAYLNELLWKTRRLRLRLRTGEARDGAVYLRRTSGTAADREAYELEVNPLRITISASTTAGLFHGATTLWQLAAPPGGRGYSSVPAVRIADSPRFAWRGVMLDSARHYQSPEFIKRFIDWMALHKLNVLHWHLTDDQAWRLEIRKYPLLTGIGAWRVPAGAAARADIDPATGKPRVYGGFYTQAAVREIVAYAAERQVTIVPEIEMPGHASAPIVAYPALAATSQPPTAVPSDWGIYPNAFNLDEATFGFLEDVLTEVMALFPSKHIHVGGDEVEKEQWKHWPAAQARMRELGLTDPAVLQTYFTQRIGRFLEANGRRLVGWDEILTPGMPGSAVVMSWRGVEGALVAASRGHDAVLAPAPTLYFDNRQSDGADEPPGRGNLVTLEAVYRFEPMPTAMKAEERRHILGLQGNLWTEHIRTEARVAHMAFPRAAAIAELGWSPPERRDWNDFVRRLQAQFARYASLGMPFADSAFAVQSRTEHTGTASRATVELFTQSGQGEIRYTLDGREPTARSKRYRAALNVPAKGEMRAAAFAGDARLSRTRTFPLGRELRLHRKSHELKLCSEHIALALEDDAPLQGARAAFLVDVQNPCWIFPDADLDRVTGVEAAVGQVPFNFQIGEDVRKIRFPQPATPEGELEVRIGNCDGELLARLPLARARVSHAVTVLPRAKVTLSPALSQGRGRHDLCLRFAQHGLDPMWVLDWIRLVER